MKKIYRIIIVFLISMLITTFSLVIYFKKSFMIIYSVYNELKKANESVETLGNLTDYNTTTSMDLKNIKYKDTLSKNVFLDIYKSNINDKPSPIIIYVHGGSFVYGDNGIPKGLEPILNAFNNRGFTIISVSYELLKNDVPIDNPIKDIKDSIRWVYKNKEEYNFDTDNIGIMGISAGAHLALMASYSDDSKFQGDEELKEYSSKVKYVLDIFGPIELNTLDTSSIDDVYKKDIDSIVNSTNTLEEYTPLKYINSSAPNTLIIHSKTDEIVPYKNAKDLSNKLNESKVKSKLLTLKSGSHYLTGYSTFEITALIFEVLKFLDINTK